MVKSSDEGYMQLGVSDEVIWLELTLKTIKSTLDSAEKRDQKDDTVMAWLRKLKEAMYEATDILDVCELEGEKCRAGSRSNPVALCLPIQGYKIRKQVKTLRQKVDAILEDNKEFIFTNVSSNQDQEGAPVIRKIETTLFPPVVMKKNEQEKKNLVDILTEEGIPEMTGDNIKVVAIVGVGGIGKTTLAQTVFRDDMIQGKFDKKIWMCVSQSFSAVGLLQQVIDGLGGAHGGTQDRSVLQHIISSEVRGKKVFLVLDDMWTPEAWMEILRIPLMSSAQAGSRVLITTRIVEIARRVEATRIHFVESLDVEDSWSLLKSQMVTSVTDEVDLERFKEIGMKILEKCKGIPLAVKVIGSLLRDSNRSKNEWEKVLTYIEGPTDGIINIASVVHLSYAYMPFDMKQLFLYHSLIPEDCVISCDKVVQMWIAEGLVQANGTSKLPEVLGMGYYRELDERSLLQHVGEYDSQDYYLMHDLVRDFAQNVESSKALVLQEGEQIDSEQSSEIRRLSVSTREVEWSALQRLHSLRTLIIIGSIIVKPGTGRTLSILSRLRTLHVNNTRVTVLLNSLHHMKCLRYLDLSYTDAFALPDDIGEMKLLQYICLQGCQNLVKIPNSIVELRKLRYLNISETKIKSIPEEGFGGLKNMVSLQGFPSQVKSDITKDWCSLGELRYMSQLMHLTLEGLENCMSGSMAKHANIGDKMNLAYLRLSCRSRLLVNGEIHQKTIEDVFDELCPPPNLEELTIKGYFGVQLPSWLISTNYAKLRVLKLENLALCNQIPSTLWKLPCLEYLCIKHALNIKRIGHEFLMESSAPCSRKEEQMMTEVPTATAETTTGTMVEITTGDAATDAGSNSVVGFPELKKLVLYGMMKWKEWDWADQVKAMPLLENMHISRCILKQLPPGLAAQVRSLRVLAIDNVKNLVSIEGFHSVVELCAGSNFKLERISDLPSMQMLTVSKCPKLNVLQRVPALQSFELSDHEMETVPEYFAEFPAGLSRLRITCTLNLLTLMCRGGGSPELEKIRHIQQVNAYADSDDDKIDKWYFFYTKHSNSIDTNIPSSASLVGEGSLQHRL